MRLGLGHVYIAQAAYEVARIPQRVLVRRAELGKRLAEPACARALEPFHCLGHRQSGCEAEQQVHVLGPHVQRQDSDARILADRQEFTTERIDNRTGEQRSAGTHAPHQVLLQGVGGIRAQASLEIGTMAVQGKIGHGTLRMPAMVMAARQPAAKR
jgi:hypothetical protein